MNDFVFTGKIIINSFCSRKTYARSQCNACIKACQFEGLSINNENLVKVINCIGCGICYNACPNDAIDLYKNTDIDIIKSVENPSFGCIFSMGKNKISCISRLNENLITFFIIKYGYIEVYKGNCDLCKFNKTLEIFEASLRKAKQILSSLNKECNIKISIQSNEPFEPNFGIPRRAILKIKEEPSKKEFLYELTKEAKINTTYEGVGQLKISEACDFCSICEAVCPKGAIVIEKKEKAGIYFNASLCSACNTCLEACPKGAIAIENGTIFDLQPKAQLLLERPQRFCNCGNIYYTYNDICPECQLKNKKKEELLNYVKDLF